MNAQQLLVQNTQLKAEIYDVQKGAEVRISELNQFVIHLGKKLGVEAENSTMKFEEIDKKLDELLKINSKSSSSDKPARKPRGRAQKGEKS